MIAEATRVTAERARGIVLSGAAGVGTASARSVPLGAFADIASDFGPDPLRRVREVIDGLIGAAGDGEVVVGVDDAQLLDDL